MSSFTENLKHQIQQGGFGIRIIFINVTVYLALNLIPYLFQFDGLVNQFKWEFLAANSNLLEVLLKPWTAFTYQFLHADLRHLFFNMLILYFLWQMAVGTGIRRNIFVTTYFVAGLAGLALFSITTYLFPLFHYQIGHPIVGASACITGVFALLTFRNPDNEVFLFGLIRLPMKYLFGIFLLIDLLAIEAGNNSGGHMSHIGGAAYGLWTGYQLKNGRPNPGAWFERFAEWLTNLVQGKRKMKVVHRQKADNKPPRDDHEYNANKNFEQQEIDRILDKISRSGYESLTKKEKDTLFNAGK